jgi:hypothetical protein
MEAGSVATTGAAPRPLTWDEPDVDGLRVLLHGSIGGRLSGTENRNRLHMFCDLLPRSLV